MSLDIRFSIGLRIHHEHLGKYRLFGLAKDHFADLYNGDCFAFLSKDRRTLKMIRYDNDGDDSRGTRPISGFQGSFIGGIQTDAYAAYRFSADVNEENKHSLCYTHIGAKFKYASDISKDKDAVWFVVQIGRLYAELPS